MDYVERIADELLADRLSESPAVQIVGVKDCGKTRTASQAAKSIARMDADRNIRQMMDLDPQLVLSGNTPRLLDEWQLYPEIWNYVRHEVDDRGLKGQFILTGSATPKDNARLHSGAGRFSQIKMRPMSLAEKGWSTKEVSLAGLMSGTVPQSEPTATCLDDILEMLTIGGWPSLLGSGYKAGLRYAQDYLKLTTEADIGSDVNKRRNPIKMMRLVQSLARNVATEASLVSVAQDTGGSELPISAPTVNDYLDVLQRLMVYEPLQSWNTHITSRDMLRKAATHHLVDPSLAIGALGLTLDKLRGDLLYVGFLFESLTVRDLRVLAEAQGGTAYHYRDSSNLEVDVVLEYPDTSWAAFEVKLSTAQQDEAAKSLLRFARKIDSAIVGKPASLNIITSNGFAFRRPDGVNVIPLTTLGV
jgi:predicted AAA+ superfamily ATPase